MSGTFADVYRRPYQPIVLRNLLSECDITHPEAAAALGVNKETLRLVVNRGYMPVRKGDFRQKVEAFISQATQALQWLAAHKLKTGDIWAESKDKRRHLSPAGHGDRAQRRNNPAAPPAVRDKRIKDEIARQKNREAMRMHRMLEILDEYGYRKNPFNGFLMETADSMRIKRLAKMAIDSKAMVSIVASWGFGKTNSIDLAMRDIKAHIVKLQTPDKERVVVSDIEKSIILALSNESCKRTKEVRARQIRRILGEAAEDKAVVLVLEEAHRMHSSTLRALKTFREMEWKGQSPLFTVLLVGQSDPLRRRDVAEVRLRSDTVFMKGLTASEVKTYIKGTVGKDFDDDAIEAVSTLEDARNFLDLQEILIELMGKALQNGARKVTSIEVFDLYGGGLKEVLRRVGLQQVDIEKETGIHKSVISQVLSGKSNTMTAEKNNEVRSAISSVIRNKLGGESKKPDLKAVNE